MWISFLMLGQKAMQPTVFCLALLISIAATSSAVAFALETDKRSINLRQAIIKTIEHNPNLRAFDYQLKAQQGRVQQAGLAPSPELSFELEDVLGTGNKSGVDSAQATLSISWVIERGTRQHYVDAARAGASLIEVEADIKQLDAAAETARLYLFSLAYQAREVNADKTIQLAEETIESVSKRVKAGKTPKAELSRAQAELARTKLEREDIEHELLSAHRRLAAQWGETIPTFVRVEGDITRLPQVASFEVLKSQLPQNPEFARLLSDQLLKKSALQLALAQDKPNWRVNAGIRHINNGRDQAFGVRIETALFVMHEKLQHSLHIIKTVSGEIIPPLEQALTETRRAYNLGRYSYLELRSVQAELLDAHNALVEASIDAHQNIIEIERLTGVRIAKPKAKS